MASSQSITIESVIGIAGVSLLTLGTIVEYVAHQQSLEHRYIDELTRAHLYYSQHGELPAWLWEGGIKPSKIETDGWYDQNQTWHTGPAPHMIDTTAIIPTGDYPIIMKTPVGRAVHGFTDGTPYNDHIKDCFETGITDCQRGLNSNIPSERLCITMMLLGFVLLIGAGLTITSQASQSHSVSTTSGPSTGASERTKQD